MRNFFINILKHIRANIFEFIPLNMNEEKLILSILYNVSFRNSILILNIISKR